jgi:tetratricopeptide (TPR) repeat protein
MKDLEKAIQVLKWAVDVTPQDHPHLAGWQNNLGNQLRTRFDRTGRMEDLEEAIQVLRRAVAVTPQDHPELVGRLNNLGIKLTRRFERTGRMKDLKKAILSITVSGSGYTDRSFRPGNLPK